MLGVTLLLLGLLIGGGTEYQVRDVSRWAGDLTTSPSHAADPVVQANAHYHLARTDAQRRGRWSLRGHGTWGLLSVVAGAALLWRGARRRVP